jgi:glycine/D-amino acid oxidase-like deaminating enzyme
VRQVHDLRDQATSHDPDPQWLRHLFTVLCRRWLTLRRVAGGDERPDHDLSPGSPSGESGRDPSRPLRERLRNRSRCGIVAYRDRSVNRADLQRCEVVRAIVIGGGIVGSHVAAELARRGAAVTLLDRGEASGSTSERSFAWINASNPDVDYLELRVRGVAAWGRIASDFGRPAWLSLPGTFTWSASPATAERVVKQAELLHALGRPAARLTVSEARRREPDLAIPAGVDVVHHFVGEGWVLAAGAIAAQLERGAAAGLDVRGGVEVRELLTGAGRSIAGVELANGERLQADVVVSCVGRFTESLLRGAGVALPMVEPAVPGSPAIGLVVQTTPTRTSLRAVLHADGLSARPDRDGGLAVHSAAVDARVPATGAVPEALAAEVLSALRRHVHHTAAVRVAQARVCFRSLPADGLPVIGPARDGLYVLATHSGVSLAPALAQLAANELIDGGDEAVLAPFRPHRFGAGG